MSIRDSIVAARLEGAAADGKGANATIEFRFPANDPLFAGHFPGHPILPGVCQIEMTRLAAEWLRGASYLITRVSRAKFTRPIRPSETIQLRLSLIDHAEGTKARAQLFVDSMPAGDIALELRR